MRRDRGYTLIEIVMVTFLLGLMVLLTVTRVDFLTSRYSLRAAGRDVAHLINIAKSQAITQGRIHYIRFDLKEHSYAILAPYERRGDLGALPGASRDLSLLPDLEWEETLHRELPDGIAFKDIAEGTGVVGDDGSKTITDITIQVTPFGQTQGYVVHLTDGKSDFSVEVNPLTGVSTLEEGYVAPPAALTDPDQ
ncbi:MAG: prepilin-type N-terminal cleavage/methylation domain-containing protein [Planctomycetes bacterium]|nr:prepilin-type N-terminal cleavage/methylation domain-containing protein [Planctomycetota bacterium]